MIDTYTNPILHEDYSDPDVIRVGDSYYMVASSFSNAPALPVLQSYDLVHWRLINYVMERLPDLRFDKPCHGQGVWAPSIRHHAGRFWVFFPMPDEGIYMCVADDPAGTWSAPHLVQAGKGLIDPCPLWDEDGSAYLVYAYAKSRSGLKSLLAIAPMRPDGMGLLAEGRVVYDGHLTQPTIEGPKLYKRAGYYYIFAPAGGVKHGWQTVLRARDIWGPYEERIVMMRGDSDINGPHQGGWVEAPDGAEWFVHFQDAGVCGRIVHLQPLKWYDGWPIIGAEQDGEGWGEPVAYHRMPVGNAARPEADAHRFGLPALDWQWNANGRRDWLTLSENGFVLHAVPHESALCDSPSLLLRKFFAPAFEASFAVDVAGLGEEARAGLVVLGRHYGALSLTKSDGSLVVSAITGNIGGGEAPREVTRLRGVSRLTLTLRVADGHCRLSLAWANQSLEVLAFDTTPGVWVGAKYGLFNMGVEGALHVTEYHGTEEN